MRFEKNSETPIEPHMKQWNKTLEIRSSPHFLGGSSTDSIMFNVVLALLPACIFSVYWFGMGAVTTLAVAVASCVLTEHLACRLTARTSTLSDWSAVVTGLLYGMTLPPSLPMWMVAVGGVLGIGIAKLLFGGLGNNCFNPALIGRALLQAAFPAAMTSWPDIGTDRFLAPPKSIFAWPLTEPVYDGLSSATPLSQWKFQQLPTDGIDLLIGTVAGSTGETSAILILLGGLYLAARRMLNWRIPFAILLTVACFSWVLHSIDPTKFAGPWFMLFSGGLMLGAVFMATDMVASPMTHYGCLLYGVFIGTLVMIIRVWGGMPEGVMYAILLGNALSPHIDYWIRPKVYGTSKPPSQLKPESQQAKPSIEDGSSKPYFQSPTAINEDGNSDGNSKGNREQTRISAAGLAKPTAASSATSPLPSQTLAPLPMTPILSMYLTLLAVGAGCGLAIASVYLLTLPLIQQNKIQFRQQAVLAVLPGAFTSQTFRWTEEGNFQPVEPDSEENQLVFAGYDAESQLVGVALLGSGRGYQDVIDIIYGYSFESQTIVGYQVLASRETPGLGDRIEREESFVKNFQGLDVRLSPAGDSLAHPIEFVKPGEKTNPWQVDGISGATISAKTVTQIISEGAEHWLPILRKRQNDFANSKK